MKRIVWLLVLGIALVTVGAPVQAKKNDGAAGAKPKRERKPRGDKKGGKGGLKGEYAIMASELKFTDAQKADLAEKLKACAENAKKWRTDNADKLADIKKKQAEARKNKDKDAMKKIAADSKALRDEEMKIRNSAVDAAKAILTDEQKVQWAGFMVYRQVMRKFKKAELTDEQNKKVRDLCNAKAKDIPEDDKKARGRAYKELSDSITNDVLTADQKAKLTAKTPKKDPADKKKKPRKGKKDKPEV